MKKMIFGCALFASMAVLATTVDSANTFGVLKVATGAKGLDKKQACLCVPWLEVGGGSAFVTNYVCTTDLAEGDWLFWYDPAGNAGAGRYYGWELSDGCWVPTQNASKYGSVDTLSNAQLARGQAVIIDTASQYVYLYGQYTADNATTVVTANQCVLLAPPSTTNYTLTASNVTSGSIGVNDYIVLDDEDALVRKQYKWDTSTGKFYYWSNGEKTETTSITITAGRGAWYISKGGAPTFTW